MIGIFQFAKEPEELGYGRQYIVSMWLTGGSCWVFEIRLIRSIYIYRTKIREQSMQQIYVSGTQLDEVAESKTSASDGVRIIGQPCQPIRHWCIKGISSSGTDRTKLPHQPRPCSCDLMSRSRHVGIRGLTHENQGDKTWCLEVENIPGVSQIASRWQRNCQPGKPASWQSHDLFGIWARYNTHTNWTRSHAALLLKSLNDSFNGWFKQVCNVLAVR
jgi:hypothetical protein